MYASPDTEDGPYYDKTLDELDKYGFVLAAQESDREDAEDDHEESAESDEPLDQPPPKSTGLRKLEDEWGLTGPGPIQQTRRAPSSRVIDDDSDGGDSDAGARRPQDSDVESYHSESEERLLPVRGSSPKQVGSTRVFG